MSKMIKRPLEDGETDQKPKKIKAQPAIEITSARQLQQILTFQQDAVPQLRSAIKSFKAFLESIVYVEDKSASLKQQSILKEFLDSQRPHYDGAIFLSDLMQAWGFALQTNNDSLLSAVSAILALLLKTVSSLVEFRSIGKIFVDTLLHDAHLKIIARSLNAPKHKEHLISPVVRLLTEAVSFDGGALAPKVFAARASTFEGKSVARNLALGSLMAESASGHDMPTVRSNTIYYLLALSRFLPASGKIELLKSSIVFKALFDGIRQDSAELTRHTFNTFKESILVDDSIPKKIKGFIFTTHNLSSIASLYRQDRKVKEKEQHPAEHAHAFLSFACTNPSVGVLRPQSAFYPPSTIKADVESLDNTNAQPIDLGLDAIGWYNSFTTNVPVRNGVLSAFIQQLKPYSNDLERLLLLAILEHAPELVADYFFKSAFAFDPKLTATWIGYSAFLFSLVRQPLPARLGRDDYDAPIPPPISIVIESILPKPCSAKVLTKCLNQQSDLITFFAMRILVLAFEKMQDASRMFLKANAGNERLWTEAYRRLRSEFMSRCPKIKDVIATYRKLKGENIHLQRETALRLLALYFTVTPELAAEENFDASVALVSALDSADRDTSNEAGFNKLELGHLLRICHQSTSATRWWHKPEGLQFSPFTCLLKIVVSSPRDDSQGGMRQILSSVLTENDVLQMSTKPRPLDALIASLRHLEELDPVLTWLDDVLGRYVKRPIKYLDDLDDIHSFAEGSPVSPIWLALTEQWPFVISRSTTPADIARWLGRYLSLSKTIGEDGPCLGRIFKILCASEGMTKQLREAVDKAFSTDFSALLPTGQHDKADGTEAAPHTPSKLTGVDVEHFAPALDLDRHTNALHKAVSMDLGEAVSSGTMSSLILCLSDEDTDVRAQALKGLSSIIERLKTPEAQASFPQAKQLYLLLGVLSNTASKLLKEARTKAKTSKRGTNSDNEDEDEEGADDLPIPYTVTSFASMAVSIVADAGHPLYANINRFLLRGPLWDPLRLPSYWVHSLLRTPPADAVPTTQQSTISSAATLDPPVPSSASTSRFDRTLHPLTALPAAAPFPHNPYHTSVHFLLSYAYHLLASASDLAILRRRGTFEPLLALASDPALPPALLDLLLGLVWRTTALRGGSTTLITRAGIVAWLRGLLARRAGRGSGLSAPNELRALLARIWESCDQARVEKWAGGTMELIVRAECGV